MRDLRYALRMLRKTPGFSLAVVLTLALGIGANSAIFSVVNGVLLRPFPFERPGDLVVVWETAIQRGLPYMYAAPANYADWREHSTSFEEMGLFRARPMFLDADNEPVRVQGAQVSAGLFDLLGVRPRIGRGFLPEEDVPDGPPAVILSHRLWTQRFGADPAILDTVVRLDERSTTVVGVMPPGFEFPPPIDLEGSGSHERSDLWTPLALGFGPETRGAHYLTAIARLRHGVELAQAESEMVAIAGRLEESYPNTNDGWSVTLVPLETQVVGDFRLALWVLLGAVGFVLLIACVNVANLLLARGTGRVREYAIRAALGADRARLILLQLTESLLLGLLGGLAGLAVAAVGVRLLLRLAPGDVPRLEYVGLDARVVGFTLVLSLLSGLVVGLVPALQSSSARLNEWLKEGGRSGASAGARSRLRNTLVVVEVALSLVLLLGAGLLIRSFLELRSIDPGFARQDVLTLRVALPRTKYERAQWGPRFAELERELAGLPGVRHAGFIHDIPLGGDRQGTELYIEGQTPDPDANRQVAFSFVTPEYFDAMGIPVRAGRAFATTDVPDRDPVVVVNESLVRRFFGDDDPIDRRVYVGFNTNTARRIVGVVGNVRHDRLEAEPVPTVYVPYVQVPWSRAMTLALRTVGDPLAAVGATRARLRELEPSAPVFDVQTMRQIVGASMSHSRFSTWLLGAFAGVALLLAVVGIYGVVSFTVVQRTRDIGLRVALGARPADILRMVLGQGFGLTLAGVALGLIGAFGLTRLLRSLLYGVGSADPLTFVAVPALLVGVAVVASWIPARRAARVDPLTALRHE